MSIMFRLMTLVMLLVSVQAVNAADEAVAAENQASSEDGGLQPAYPAWPERQTRKNDVPPPPPGPYMSTALTYAGQGFSCCPGSETGGDGEQKIVHSPFFKGMPWPEKQRPPQRWLPEGGEYTYAPDDIPVPSQAERYGYQGRPAWQPIYPPPRGYR